MNTEKYLKGTISFLEKYGKTRKEKAEAEILKQCLEERQALEIIVKKRVDVYLIVHSLTKEKKLDYYNIMCPMNFELTQEEYDLVSKVVKEIDKGDDTNG